MPPLAEIIRTNAKSVNALNSMQTVVTALDNATKDLITSALTLDQKHAIFAATVTTWKQYENEPEPKPEPTK